MLEKYKVVYKGGQDEIIEKKSRFIATVAPVESEEEARLPSRIQRRYSEGDSEPSVLLQTLCTGE